LNKWKLTDKEKQLLTYHPSLKYIREKISSPGYNKTNVFNEQNSFLLSNIATDTWVNIQDLLTYLSVMISGIESRYLDDSLPTAIDAVAPLSDEDRDYIKAFDTIYFVPDISNGISFRTYRLAIDEAPEPLRSFIMEIYESYHMGVNGINEVEVYRDLREIYEDWSMNKSFFLNVVLTKVDKSAPSSLTSGGDGLSRLSDKEHSEISDLISMTIDKARLESEISRIILNNSGEPLTAKENEYTRLHSLINTQQDKLNNKAETTNATNLKLSYVRNALDKVQSLVSLQLEDAYSSEINVSVKELLNVIDKSDIQSVIVSLSSMMKTHETRLRDIDKKRRSFVSNKTKSQINNDLTYESHMRSNLTKPLTRKLMNINDDDIPNAIYMIDRIANGIVESEKKYTNQLDAYHSIDKVDNDMRTSRFNEIEDKHYTRSYYKVMSSISKFIQDTGNVPSDTDIDSIIKNIK